MVQWSKVNITKKMWNGKKLIDRTLSATILFLRSNSSSQTFCTLKFILDPTKLQASKAEKLYSAWLHLGYTNIYPPQDGDLGNTLLRTRG